MADQSYGLRFDIYERVHLSEDVIGIEELEEIELIPKIQVIPGEEYAALRGHLLLSGLYRGQGESCKLEHWIPVEITIPLSRVNKLEEIAVEIDNFDVDLLSARSLNITGVLSLKGIETTTLTGSEEWKDREFIAAHESHQDEPDETCLTEQPLPLDTLRQEEQQLTEQISEGPVSGDRENQASQWQSSLEAAEDLDLPDFPETPHQNVISWTDDSLLSSPSLWKDKAAVSEDEIREAVQQAEENLASFKEEEQRDELEENHLETPSISEQEGDAVEVVQAVSRETDQAASSEQGAESEPVLSATTEPEAAGDVAHEDSEPEIRPQPEEKKELKIALNSKKADETVQGSDIGITKLLSAQRPNKEPEGSLEQEEGNVKAAAELHGDEEEVRWKNLFIGNAEEQTPFRKIRLVIVQREETLDEIAERYNLSTRELQLYNRLAEHNLAEGQVLYIP
ncbi:LysM peptidoglycan-binding domain-containing protein [Paenibacillus woosongensis]|uniref:LysM peptidoglycan-binding domain-containing protein n=1 Tax=Paenibacillus woosongensis TaxID=307580 RepID=A0A7X2Z271_9BACL|nr:LysM peptidoglycan-binding domain-containing protein [Paenibacillus woosongensis]MUG46116.1 LysM peptidoglycan-binding domain-containing protein [Paenibacillus woosongensis]